MAMYSIILVWRIPWTEEPDRLQSMESQAIDGSAWIWRLGVPSTRDYSLQVQAWAPLLAHPPSSPSPTQSCLETQGCSGSWGLSTSPRPEGDTTGTLKFLHVIFYFIMESSGLTVAWKTADSVDISMYVFSFVFPSHVDHHRVLSSCLCSIIGLADYVLYACYCAHVHRHPQDVPPSHLTFLLWWPEVCFR